MGAATIEARLCGFRLRAHYGAVILAKALIEEMHSTECV